MKSEAEINALIKEHRDKLVPLLHRPSYESGFKKGYTLGYAHALERVLKKEKNNLQSGRKG